MMLLLMLCRTNTVDTKTSNLKEIQSIQGATSQESQLCPQGQMRLGSLQHFRMRVVKF